MKPIRNFARLAALMILFSTLSLSCNKGDGPEFPDSPQPVELSSLQYKLIESNTSFALDLFREVINFDSDSDSDSESENIMISPLSVSYALSMTTNGAAGSTLDSMMYALKFEDMTVDDINNSYYDLANKLKNLDKRVIFNIANSVWVEKNFNAKAKFIDALKDSYSAELMNFSSGDPSVPELVNKWIADNTNNKITDVIGELDPNIVMMLVNAIYFKGKWKFKFDTDDTRDMPFYTGGNNTVSARMMTITADLKYAEREMYTIAELPYGQGNFVMDVILPSEGNNVRDVIDDLDAGTLNDLFNEMHTGEVKLYMPRFKYKYKVTLNDPLSSMGMGNAFKPGIADFTNISDDPLYISKVLHNTFIENNEEGTEAAAVTVVTIGITSVGPERVLKLDRPFIYIIRETETNTTAFIGITGNPAE